ncbi:MAG: Sulfite reductase [NADPH] flavoprotein alpha-component [Pseudoclavibacter caeni]|jgi:MioC protein
MQTAILFGTESGNAELIAYELQEHLAPAIDAEVLDMSETPATQLDPDAFYLVICSTYGEGDLPAGAVPFKASLDEHRPDLHGMRYAMFGLGDSTYDTYSQGSEIIDRAFAELGATRVGEYGRHDAASWDRDMTEIATEWADDVLAAAAI